MAGFANNTGYQGALNQASQIASNAMQPIGAAQINQYMSPYTSDVVGALQQASNLNFQQNQMPAISSQFVGAGQAASPQMAQADNNALYQNNVALNSAVSSALQSGYQGALNTALQEQQAQQTGANQLAQYGIQGAQIAQGNAQGQLAAAGQYGQLGALTGQLGALDTGQLAAAGSAQDTYNQSNINAALNNFYAQQQWPYQNLAYASNIVRGQNIPSNTQTVGTAYIPNEAYAPSPLSSFVGTTLGASSLFGNSSNASNQNTTQSQPTQSTTGNVYGARGGRVPGALSRYKRAA